ncbi:SRPBCC family protein [Roseivirga pacifica]|uniref:SRPBCC family protein n=1 Tax=Roseivirga pacifica TaxID=1267423 RepID=UPI003BAEB393
MPKMNVSRSLEIKTSPENVYNSLIKMDEWQKWSPWLILEPETKVTVRDDNRFYEWDGKRIGSGNMEVVGEKEFERIDFNLVFLTPWKSQADVTFHLSPSADGTKVTWVMASSMPFFMFFMKKMMESFVGMDFERGLKLLKDYLEDGEVHSKLEFTGEGKYEGCQYLGLKTSCGMDEIGEAMAKDFSELMTAAEPIKGEVSGAPFTIYHKWNIAKGKVDYTVGVPLKKVPDTIPNGLSLGSLPSSSTYTVTHTGPYHHLGNAWGAQMNLSRSKAYKQNKKMDPFEVYVSDPSTTAPNELITEIRFPIK